EPLHMWSVIRARLCSITRNQTGRRRSFSMFRGFRRWDGKQRPRSTKDLPKPTPLSSRMQYGKVNPHAALDADPLLLFLEAVWLGLSPAANACIHTERMFPIAQTEWFIFR